MRDPTQWPVVERDFARMHQLDVELEVETQQEYYYDPTEDQKTQLLFKPRLSIDLETSGKMGKPDTKITHISVSPAVKESYLIRPRDPVARDILQHPYIIGQNWLQADAWEVWRTYGIKFETLWDTRLGGHLLNPDTPNNLVYLSREFASPPARGYWKTKEDYKERKDNVALVDADVTNRVYQGEYDALVDRSILDIMESEIMPLCNVLLDMRIGGMRLDRETLGPATEIMKQDVTELRKELPEWEPTASGERTENQNAHVHHYLYTVLGLPVQTKRGEGSVTADVEALRKLQEWLTVGHKKVEHLTHAVVEEGLRYIGLHLTLKAKSKLTSEFAKYEKTGVDLLHPILNPAGTGTFRFSSSDPNVQQISKCRCKPKCMGKNPECRGARHVFLPDEDDWVIVRLDLKQAEVVTFLWYAQEWDILRKVLCEGADVHQLVADKMGLDRDSGKTCTFATLYDATLQNVAARMGRTLLQVEEMFEAFNKALPGVDDYRSRFVGMAMQKGYVETPFRLRRYIRVTYPKGRAARQAGNAPIQAVPPWVLRRAMNKIHRELPKPARLWTQIHDELDIVTPRELLSEVIDCARAHITAPVPELEARPIGMHEGLQFASDIEVGKNFGALYPLEQWMEDNK
jgi:DNA polymerase I-like protein with 3'-5' exonuclease and polymerase domains